MSKTTTKTIIKNGNIRNFADTEDETATEMSEVLIPKQQFIETVKHTKFIIDNCRKDIINYKTERDTLALQLTELEKVAETQFKHKKELEKQLKTANAELDILKNTRNKQYSKCGIDLMKTDDINVLNAQIEQEVKNNIEKNKLKIVDPYLESIYKKFEIQK